MGATYDTKCFDLAEAFLSDAPHLATHDRADELAALIQRTIEEFIAHAQSNYEPAQHGDAWAGGFAENH